jgi:competence protein ComEC
MIKLSSKPLFYMAVGLLLGAKLCQAVPIPNIVFLVAALCFGSTIIFWKKAALSLLVLAAFSIGCVDFRLAAQDPPSELSIYSNGGVARVEGTVLSDSVSAANHDTFYLHASSVTSNIRQDNVNCSLFIVLEKKNIIQPEIEVGDHVRLNGLIRMEGDSPSSPTDMSLQGALARRGVYYSMMTIGAAQKAPTENENPLRRFLGRLKLRLLRSLQNSLDKNSASLIAGILLGMRSQIPTNMLWDFSSTGTYHILATAGLHLGILIYCIRSLFSALLLPNKWNALLTIAAVWGYDIIAGERMAVTRAAIMATIYLLGIVFERSPDILNSLGAAAIIILMIEPLQAFDPGFLISFGTVFIIGLTMPLWDELQKAADERLTLKGKRRLCAHRGFELLGLTLMAQTGAAPLCAYLFNSVTLLGGIANLIVVPIIFLLIPLSLLDAIIGILFPAASSLLGRWMIEPLARATESVVVFFAHLPYSHIAVPAPSGWIVALFYAAAGAVLLPARQMISRQIRIDAAGRKEKNSEST